MRTIQTTVDVDEEHRASIQFPADIPPGPHRVVLTIEEEVPVRPPLTFSAHDVGAWPEGFTASREQIYDDSGRGS